MLLLAGFLLFAIAPEAFRRKDLGLAGILTAAALSCCVAALAYVTKARVLVIDRLEGRLRVLTRPPFRRTEARARAAKAAPREARGPNVRMSSSMRRTGRPTC